MAAHYACRAIKIQTTMPEKSKSFSIKEIEEAAELYPSLWIEKYDIKTSNGIPFEFHDHKFMLDIVNDMSPLQVGLKPPQIGWSESKIVKTFYVADKKGKDIIYTLPTATDRDDMVSSKVNRIIAQNPILQKMVKDHDTVGQKSVGSHLIHYRGTFAAKQAMMVSSDLNVHDEVDASDPSVITQYETRLEAKAGGWRWYFSHPSLAGHGVDIYWQQSDKKEWFVTCPTCLAEQVLTWPQNIDTVKGSYICSSCKGSLSDDSRRNGVWKATAEGIFSGYHVSQLMCPWISAENILEKYSDPRKDSQYFWNYVLGLPYVGSEDKIDPDTVLKNVTSLVNEQEGRIVIGVDTGLPIYYTLGNEHGIFYYGKCKPPENGHDPYTELEALLKRFPRSVLVSDQGGDLIGIRTLQSKYPGRIFLCYYRKDRKNSEVIRWGTGNNYGTVTVDRNRMMQLMVEQLRDIGRIPLNGTPNEWKEWASHFGNIYRKAKETPLGFEYVWERSGPDHFCFVKGTKIATNNGDKPIEDIRVGDMALTRNGYKRVYDAGLNRKNQRVVTAYFSNGTSFTATPDHPVIHTQGKEALSDLSVDAILYSCNPKQYYTKASRTDVTQTLSEEPTESISAQMEPIEQKGTKGFISKYGLILTALFLKVLSSTIKTKIRLTTNLVTWCVKKEQSICHITHSTDSKTLSSELKTSSILVGYGSRPTIGDVLKKVRRGTHVTLLKALSFLSRNYLCVLSATLKVLHVATKAVSSVPPNVVIVGLHENIERKDVINLSVEDEHEYFANGILVSNCHSLLYLLVGLDKYAQDQAQVVAPDVFEGLQTARIFTDTAPEMEEWAFSEKEMSDPFNHL